MDNEITARRSEPGVYIMPRNETTLTVYTTDREGVNTKAWSGSVIDWVNSNDADIIAEVLTIAMLRAGAVYVGGGAVPLTTVIIHRG